MSSTVKIRLFGEVGAVTDTGDPIDVGPAKCQTVLAALALSPGSAVPLWRLVDVVWGEEPPRTAERTLQSYITRLRKGLGPNAITRTGDAYRLNVADNAVDVGRFKGFLNEGNVEAALQEWTGTPLAGLDAPGLDGTILGLNERWVAAVELDLERRIDVDPAEYIGRLTELTAAHPFREGLWALLMTALYRVGRQADALAAYRSARQQLVDELGVEPSRRLQDLEVQILRQEECLEAGRSPVSAAASLPAGTVTFVFTSVPDAAIKWGEHGAAMSEAMARHHDSLQTLVSRHDGHMFSRSGDSFGAVFTSAGRAKNWAIEMHEAMRSESWPGEIDLRVCVGIHTGEAEEHEGGYFGPAVNIAARLATAGHGEQSLLSETTARILDDEELQDLGWYRLDGVVAEQHVFQLGPGTYPALRIEDRFRGNLPRRLGRLIGREQELDTIVDALANYPVVTLVGPGGIGKTRLALAAAELAEVSGDAWLLDLAEIDSPDQVPRAVADTLDLAEQPDLTLVRSIVDALRSRQALLVLDNCEHVIHGAAELAEAIARGCSSVRLVATSRERLGVANERIITVPPLDPTGPAIDLFNQRAMAISATFDSSGDRPAVEEICRRLDGIPLAIELAAAHTRSLSPADLADRLEHRLRVLDGTRRTGADRHRTLRSAIQWSYNLLTPTEQTLFQRLTVFTGTFDLAGAEHVASGPHLDSIDVDTALSRLVEQSILTVESGAFGRRFRLFEPIRDFGAEQLEQSQERELAQRHARWCLSEVTDIGLLLAGWGEIEGVARLAELWPNLRAAFGRACAAADRDLARGLVRPILSEIILRSNYEIGDWLEDLLAIAPPDNEEELTFGLYWAAHRYAVSQNPAAYQRLVDRYAEPDHPLMRHGRAYVTGDYKGQAEWAQKAAEELRRRGDDHLAERAEINVATAWLNLGRYDECDVYLERLLSRYREQGPPTFVNWTLLLLGYSASFQGRQDHADAYFDEAIAVEVPPRTHTPNKPLEARAAFRRGNYIRAFRILQSHIEELLTTDNMQASGIDCIEFINMMTQIGRLTEASRILNYLETTGLLDAPAWRTLIDSSATVIAKAQQDNDAANQEVGIDDRQALGYMREVLDRLMTEEQTAWRLQTEAASTGQ